MRFYSFGVFAFIAGCKKTVTSDVSSPSAPSTSEVPIGASQNIPAPLVPRVPSKRIPSGPPMAPMPADGIFTSPTGESYKTGSRLGVGSQGEVFEAVRKSDGEVVALKRVRKPVTAAREVAAMKAVVGQAGFAQISDEFPHAENHVIIMNVLGKSVNKLKKSDNKLTPQTVGSIALQMIDRFETLHRLGYVHGDMYPNNLLLDASEENVIVIDFGQARPTTKGGDEINKVSDARSLSHSVLRLFNPDTAFGSYQHVGSTALSKVCEGLPAPVEELFRYTHMTLTHGDGPNYNLMRSLMRKLAPGYTGKVIA